LLLVASLWPATRRAAGSDAADAVQKKDLGALRALVQRKTDVNGAQPDGTTALHWAVVWNNDEAINLLLRAGADVKARNRYGATPLSEAVSSGSPAMVEALLKAGADAKTLTTDDGETVLDILASQQHRRGAGAAGARRGRERARNYRGQTALMWAAADVSQPWSSS
jgi:ankyrin repeat protein